MARGGVERSNFGIERKMACTRNKENGLGTMKSRLGERGKSSAARSLLAQTQAQADQTESAAYEGEGSRFGRVIQRDLSGADRTGSRGSGMQGSQCAD